MNMIKQRKQRMYQAKHRASKRSYKSELENVLLLLAWEASLLSEGQVSKMLDIDRVSLRMLREGSIARGMEIAQELDTK